MIPSPPAARLDETPRDLVESLRDEDIVFALHRGRACRGHDLARNGGWTPGLAVVICTHRRAESLARFLDSLARQDVVPEALVIVDASADEDTQILLSKDAALDSRAGCVLYFRVRGRWKELTRQRNFAARWVRTDLLAFFDDDVVLMPGCLSEMQRIHRDFGLLDLQSIPDSPPRPYRPKLAGRGRIRVRVVVGHDFDASTSDVSAENTFDAQ